jgi:hypothetical protein
MRAGQGPFACRLDEIVRFDGGAGQASGETPEPGQNSDELVVERRTHRPIPRRGWAVRSCLTVLQRVEMGIIPSTEQHLNSLFGA